MLPVQDTAIDDAGRCADQFDGNRGFDLHRQIDFVQVDMEHAALGGMELDLLDHGMALGHFALGRALGSLGTLAEVKLEHYVVAVRQGRPQFF